MIIRFWFDHELMAAAGALSETTPCARRTDHHHAHVKLRGHAPKRRAETASENVRVHDRPTVSQGLDTAINHYLPTTKITNVTKSDADTDQLATMSVTNGTMCERRATIMMIDTATIGAVGVTKPAVHPQNLDTAAGARKTGTAHHAPIEIGVESGVENTAAVIDRGRTLPTPTRGTQTTMPTPMVRTARAGVTGRSTANENAIGTDGIDESATMTVSTSTCTRRRRTRTAPATRTEIETGSGNAHDGIARTPTKSAPTTTPTKNTAPRAAAVKTATATATTKRSRKLATQKSLRVPSLPRSTHPQAPQPTASRSAASAKRRKARYLPRPPRPPTLPPLPRR